MHCNVQCLEERTDSSPHSAVQHFSQSCFAAEQLFGLGTPARGAPLLALHYEYLGYEGILGISLWQCNRMRWCNRCEGA